MEDLSETVETYESVAEEYASRHGDRSVVEDQRERFLDALDPAPHPGTDGDRPRVLDAGCGPGWETAAFADRGCSVLGIDLARPFVRRTRERLRTADDGGSGRVAGAARMDMRRLGVPTDALDGVWACASFLHVPREEAPGTLAEFARVLRPGGVATLAVKRGSGTRAADAYEGDGRRFVLYQPGAIRGMVEDAGLAVEYVHADEAAEEPWIVVVARR